LLNNPDEAIRVAQDSQSIEGAKLVATHFMKIKDYSSAIRFIVVSKANQEAFAMAKAHNQMELYADIIGADATKEDFLNIAGHFEETNNHLQAGKFFLKAENYEKVLRVVTMYWSGHCVINLNFYSQILDSNSWSL